MKSVFLVYVGNVGEPGHVRYVCETFESAEGIILQLFPGFKKEPCGEKTLWSLHYYISPDLNFEWARIDEWNIQGSS